MSGQREVRRIARLHVGYQVFFSMLLWLPVFYEFQKRNGLVDSEIFSIQSAYYFAFCVFEIPTGWLADRFGYVRCLKAGAWLVVASNLVPCFAPGYPGMMLHFMGIALSRSLASGSGSAWLYESLSALGAKSSYKEIEGRARALGLIAKVILWLGIGAMMEWRLDLPYSSTALLTAFAIPIAYRMSEPGSPKAERLTLADEARKAESGWLAAWKAVRESRALGLLMLQGVGLFVLTRIVQVNLFQPILGAKGVGVGYYGAVLSAMTLCEALGSAKPGWLKGKLSDEGAVFGLTAVMAIAIGVTPWLGPWGAGAALCLFSLAMGFAFPVQKQLINDAIPGASSRARATLLSLESLIDRSACAAVAWVLGASLASVGLDRFLIAAAVAAIAVLWVVQAQLKSRFRG